MAFNNSSNYNRSPNYGRPNQPQGQRQYNNNAPQPVQEIKAMPLPADYVDAAENTMRKIKEKYGTKTITTNKLRNLLSIVSDIYNSESLSKEEKLSAEGKTAVAMMRIRVAYEAGRERSTKEFIEETKLLEYIKDIGDSREKLIAFAHYMEALVAYHRYYINN